MAKTTDLQFKILLFNAFGIDVDKENVQVVEESDGNMSAQLADGTKITLVEVEGRGVAWVDGRGGHIRFDVFRRNDAELNQRRSEMRLPEINKA